MPWQNAIYAILLFITTGTLVAFALYAQLRRGVAGAAAFVWLALAVAEWVLTYALELGTGDIPRKIVYAQLQYLGIGSVPLAWLAFTLQYTGKGAWLTRRKLALLLIEPLITLLPAFTNASHGLIWSSIDYTPRLMPLDVEHGPWFWVHVASSYIFMSVGSLLLVQQVARSRHLYRRQAAVLLLGAVAPWLGNALYVFRANPLHPLDLTPAGFALSALAVGWALFRFRLLDIVPVAHTTIVTGLRDGIIVLDARGRVVDLNPAAERVLGRPVAIALGQPVERLLADHPDLVACFRDSIEERIEVTLGRAEAARNYEAQLTLLRNRHGRASGQLLILHDVTEHKQSAAALLAAKEAAERATHAKSEFLAMMSHEIRTPMTGVLGVTDLLLLTNLTSQQREFVEIMRASGDALLRIINDLLDISRIESGNLDIQYAPFALRACLEESLDLVAADAAKKQLDLSYSIDPQVPITLLGDSDRLRQILINLLSNAIKFTDNGAVVVSVAAHKLGEWRYEVQFAIKDTGIGIPNDQLSRLFTSFSQIDPAIVRSRAGAGLGLAISKRISELMGGMTWVVSEEGHGSTFYFTIVAEAIPSEARIYKQQHSLAARAASPAPMSQHDTQSTALHCLVAEDDSVNQKLMLYILRELGYQADVASNGRDALGALEQQSYDVALLDVELPEVDGMALARQICLRWPPDRRPYLIAVTGHVLPGDRECCLSAGMDDYIAKPVRLAELVEAIGKRSSRPGQPPMLLARAVGDPVAPAVSELKAAPSAFIAAGSRTLASVLETLDESRPQLLCELIDAYLLDTPELLAIMHVAVAQRHAGALRSAAHKLKSSSGFLGATDLVSMCKDLEQLLQVDASDTALEQVLQIEAEYARVKAALELRRSAAQKTPPEQAAADDSHAPSALQPQKAGPIVDTLA
jgi:PAS domain S-box-containing protein